MGRWKLVDLRMCDFGHWKPGWLPPPHLQRCLKRQGFHIQCAWLNAKQIAFARVSVPLLRKEDPTCGATLGSGCCAAFNHNSEFMQSQAHHSLHIRVLNDSSFPRQFPPYIHIKNQLKLLCKLSFGTRVCSMCMHACRPYVCLHVRVHLFLNI